MNYLVAPLWLPVAVALAIAQPPREQPKIDVVGAGETAMELARTTLDPDAKWMAIRILGNLHHERAIPLLLTSLSDPHHYVRANAARALGDMRVAGAAEPLRELLQQEKNGGVIQQTSLALTNLRSKGAIPALKGASRHEDVQTRMWVLQAIGELGARRDVSFLAAFLEDPNDLVQMSAAQAVRTHPLDQDGKQVRATSIRGLPMGVNVDAPGLTTAEETFLQALLWEEAKLVRGPVTRTAEQHRLSLLRCLEPANRLSPNLQGDALNRLCEGPCPAAAWPWGNCNGDDVLRLLWSRLTRSTTAPSTAVTG
jgi:HEAT repeat protein